MIGFTGSLFANQIYFPVDLRGTDSITFKLYAGENLVLNETYYGTNSKETVRISLEEVISEFVKPELPGMQDIIFKQPAAGQQFRIDSEGFYDDNFRIIGKKIAFPVNELQDFLSKNFLTYDHSDRMPGKLTPHFLSYYATEDCQAKITAMLPDGNLAARFFALTPEAVHTINMTPYIIRQLFGSDITDYEICIETPAFRRLSEVIRFHVCELSENAETYLYANEMGGWDTLIFTGDFVRQHNLETTINEMEDIFVESNPEYEETIKQNTGYLTPVREVSLLDFMGSSYRFHVVNGLPRPIVMKDTKASLKKYGLNSAEFEFRYQTNERITERELPQVILPLPPYPEKLVYCIDQIRDGKFYDRITGKPVIFGRDYIDFSALTEDGIFDRQGGSWTLLDNAGGRYYWPAYNFDYAYIKGHAEEGVTERLFYHAAISGNPRTVYPILVYDSSLTQDQVLAVEDYLGLPHNRYENGSIEDDSCSLRVSVSFIVNDYTEVILQESGFYAQIGESIENK